MKNLPLLLRILLLLQTLPTQAQSPQPTPGQLQTIHRFLDGYNRQDYKEIRSTYSWVFKRLFSKKTVGQVYGTQYKMLGPVHLVQVHQRSATSWLLELSYAADTTEHVNLGLGFTKKYKVIGLGSNTSEKYEFSKF